MILVDSSVWIDFFNGNDTPQTTRLDELLGLEPVGLGDLILTEVLQGFGDDNDYRTAKRLLSKLTIYKMLDVDRAIRAADLYRRLRKQGITIRKTADVIIGSFCIEENYPLLYSDRDFDPIVRNQGLVSVLGAT